MTDAEFMTLYQRVDAGTDTALNADEVDAAMAKVLGETREAISERYYRINGVEGHLT